jgi:hypothetical protein
VLGYAYVSRAAAQGLGPAKETLAQLDTLLPLDQRKKGVALAKAKAKAAPPPQSAKPVKSAKPAKPVQVATAKPAPAPAPQKSAPVSALKPTPPAPASGAPASGAWRIQVGAFNNRPAAEAAYRKIAGVGALAGRGPQYIPFGQFIRLRVGPFATRDAAASACTAVKVACFPVAPGK